MIMKKTFLITILTVTLAITYYDKEVNATTFKENVAENSETTESQEQDQYAQFYTVPLKKELDQIYVGKNLGFSFNYPSQLKIRNNDDTYHGMVDFESMNPFMSFSVSDFTENPGNLENVEKNIKAVNPDAVATRIEIGGKPAIKVVFSTQFSSMVEYSIEREPGYFITVRFNFMPNYSFKFAEDCDNIMKTFKVLEPARS
ncbi:hypothetical protein HRJ35_06295 [Shewanella oneidensis MR-1]|uniref:Uncharacterized protein n=2 Tax=Shewanella oneidensis TaxID=70863 RepID=Q8EIQ1_SHEON|nr:hypothetical protein [Shewanella oneidensis]AAN53862.2 uncharacterized protein SO_0786 [Shewanella oneidensis MR-1]MDX5997307.1 hypothetical protein [Shewanella oneidensis]MEE2029881.1 hypothetical protein [Shewanella oneidensis]QKG95653.1 hypothetical protein HRJ35_06295 [Shewanella oneidensis MR-1]